MLHFSAGLRERKHFLPWKLISLAKQLNNLCFCLSPLGNSPSFFFRVILCYQPPTNVFQMQNYFDEIVRTQFKNNNNNQKKKPEAPLRKDKSCLKHQGFKSTPIQLMTCKCMEAAKLASHTGKYYTAALCNRVLFKRVGLHLPPHTVVIAIWKGADQEKWGLLLRNLHWLSHSYSLT